MCVRAVMEPQSPANVKTSQSADVPATAASAQSVVSVTFLWFCWYH